MAEFTIHELFQKLLYLCQNPYAKIAFVLAKTAKDFIEGDPVQSAVRITGEIHLQSAKDAMEDLEVLEKEEGISEEAVNRATDAVLGHLRDAYYAYFTYYQDVSKGKHRIIPDLWCFRQLRMSMRGAALAQDKIIRICCLMAVYHKALGNSTAIVRKWLFEKAFPCDNYELIENLLGQEAALEYLASHPAVGARIAGQYLSQTGVSLEDYSTEPLRYEDSERISFGMEDPIFVD